ncbi:hypothetical protein D3C80_2116820 [compost metagenome]
MSITVSTAKPSASASKAVSPAMNRRLKVYRAATTLCVPLATSLAIPFIFWAPWLAPIANTRNGTSTVYGSST